MFRTTRTEEGMTTHDITVYDSTTGSPIKFEQFVGSLVNAENKARELLKVFDYDPKFEVSIESMKNTWVRPTNHLNHALHYKKD